MRIARWYRGEIQEMKKMEEKYTSEGEVYLGKANPRFERHCLICEKPTRIGRMGKRTTGEDDKKTRTHQIHHQHLIGLRMHFQ
jgi:hypothetical protein